MKKRLLLLSNGAELVGRDTTTEFAHAAARDFLGGRARRAFFVPFASVVKSYDEYAARVREVFAEMAGCEVVSAHEAADAGAAVRSSDLIIVGGGNTFHLLRGMYEAGLVEAVRGRVLSGGAAYVGWSAGSNVACPTIRTTNDMPIVEPPGFDALGLVPFQINPHYTDARLEGHQGETRDDRLTEFVHANPSVRVVGLREGTMLRVEGDTAALVGDGPARVFVKGSAPFEVGPADSLSFLFG
jgi:dipeptidase E